LVRTSITTSRVADQIGPLLLVLHATHPGDIEIRFRKKSPLG
jgi:hypothetical protein